MNLHTSLNPRDEVDGGVLAGVGNDQGVSPGEWHSANDRILHDWLGYAGRWEDKTITAKLAAIREFEAFLGGREFAKVTQAEVGMFRDALKSRVESASPKRLSASTVRHRASHLKDFFGWLVEQKGYRKLGRALPSYFDLPKRFEAVALSTDERQVPSMDEAVAVVEGLPRRTMKERRDRAMVAIAFLGALRADTISSLRVGHFRVSEQIVVQDASVSRTKNGKSLRVRFFPLPAIFVETVTGWKQELLDLGFGDNDALFPDEKQLIMKAGPSASRTIPVMSSTHAVTAAFKTASGLIGKSFSPHSAKHCMGQLAWKVCDTPHKHNGWSANMGHEDEKVTLRHYKKLSEESVFAIFEDFAYSAAEETLEDKELMLRFKECDLNKGTPEWHRANWLLQERSKRKAGQTGRD